jgi:thymidylate synthase
MSNQSNLIYQAMLAHLMVAGQRVHTRNSDSFSCIDYPRITLNTTPLVTVRRTAWKNAIREMEWFMSGDIKCPEELIDWWNGQLGYGNMYRGGYSDQLRKSGNTYHLQFDQVKYILDGLKNNPNSRRLVATTWNPYDMANITMLNNNSQTPSTCHGTLIQFFVRDNKVIMCVYQRSADVLLGVPHNWIQYWALLLYFATHSNLEVGSLMWLFGDLHLYDEQSHIATAKQIIHCQPFENPSHELEYQFSGETLLSCPKFKASDFSMKGIVPQPIVLTRPKLLA